MNILPTRKLIIVLSLILIPLLTVSIIFSQNHISKVVKPTNVETQDNLDKNDLGWNIIQTQNGEVDVYLQGASASKVTALELDASIDKQIKVSRVTPGGFFANPIKVKFDDKNLVYSLMINPDEKAANDPSKPVFKLILSPTTLTGYNFSILPKSLVYLQNIGGVHPKQSQITLE